MGTDFRWVGADHCLILLANSNASDWPELTAEGRVLEAHPPLGLWLTTGTHTGIVGVRLTVHTVEPPLDTEVWPHHEVVRLFLASATFQALPIGGLGEVVDATLPCPGEYFVRAAWSGRPRSDHNEYAEEGAERYLLDVWPA